MRPSRIATAAGLGAALTLGLVGTGVSGLMGQDSPRPGAVAERTTGPAGSPGRVLPTTPVLAPLLVDMPRDPVLTRTLLHSLDPCRVVRAAGQRPLYEGSHWVTCRADLVGARGWQVQLDASFTDQDRYNATRQVMDGVVVYTAQSRGQCRKAAIPFSPTRALVVAPLLFGSQSTAPPDCSNLPMRRIVHALTAHPRSLQRVEDSPPPLTAAPFWYTASENDRAVTGSCTTVSWAARDACASARPVTVPRGRTAFTTAAARDPDLVCAATRQAVREAFPLLTALSTVTRTVHAQKVKECVYSEPGRRVELRISTHPTRHAWDDSSEGADGLNLRLGTTEQPFADAALAEVSHGELPGLITLVLSGREAIDLADSSAPDPARQSELKRLLRPVALHVGLALLPA